MPSGVDSPAADLAPAPSTRGSEWWRSSVIYQVYPRSFADSTGDGVGDIRGVTAHLDDLAWLGVDAVWLSPFYRSPQNDGGYDVADYTDVDPLFGTLADVDELIAEAHERELKVLVDLVPNHSSSEHPWFRAALAAAPGSPERARYLFRDGRGVAGAEPPNNWQSLFGGPAWTRVPDGQWYLHLFDSTQPDFDWENPEVADFFDSVLRFWLDRGVDGFRVDVAHGNIKAPGLPDVDQEGLRTGTMERPYLGLEGVHRIYRRWNSLLAEYAGDRMMCGEAWVHPLEKLARYTRPDEMQQVFNFTYLQTPWDAEALRVSISDSLAAFGAVGAPSTWVLSNHDTIRHTTRLALVPQPPHGQGVGPDSPSKADPHVEQRRGRAASALMLALPGSAYVYQGDELGLPEVIDLAPEARQDPTFARTGGRLVGRDGSRVPMPWAADAPAYGFSETGNSWLPQPASWRALAHDGQRGVDDSTLELYRRALAARRAHALGAGDLEWVERGDGVLSFRNGPVTVITVTGTAAAELPEGAVILTTAPLESTPTGIFAPPDSTVWLTAVE